MKDLKELVEDYEFVSLIRNALFSLFFADMAYMILKYNDSVAKKLLAHDDILQKEIKQPSHETLKEASYELQLEENKIVLPSREEVEKLQDNPFQNNALTEKEFNKDMK